MFKTVSDIATFCKDYGFIFQSSEIYGGMQAIYDYGHYGSLLKQNVKSAWMKEMVQKHNNIVNIDSAIIMHPNIWHASGHIDNFDDLMIDNKDSKKRYRVDVYIEQLLQEGEISQSDFEECNSLINNNKIEEISKWFIKKGIKCKYSGTCNWTAARRFNLMFSCKDVDDNTLYLRPETAQGIYVNFLNIMRTTHQKIPFGIAQIGKAFRNEIIARQLTFRMKEFEQMEMQFFITPGEDEEYFEYWKEQRMSWYLLCLQA